MTDFYGYDKNEGGEEKSWEEEFGGGGASGGSGGGGEATSGGANGGKIGGGAAGARAAKDAFEMASAKYASKPAKPRRKTQQVLQGSVITPSGKEIPSPQKSKHGSGGGALNTPTNSKQDPYYVSER